MVLCVVPVKWRRAGSLLISNLNENLASRDACLSVNLYYRNVHFALSKGWYSLQVPNRLISAKQASRTLLRIKSQLSVLIRILRKACRAPCRHLGLFDALSIWKDSFKKRFHVETRSVDRH